MDTYPWKHFPLRIVLVGKTGSGKSATGNTILGKKAFPSKHAAQSVTKTCRMKSREWNGREIQVVDTPGFFDTKEQLNATCREISQCVLLSRPGPHVFLMVIQPGRFTKEEEKTIALFKLVFGKSVMKNTIILFTHKDELEDGSITDFIADADVNLKSLIRECGDRVCAFNNKAEEPEKEAQVRELVQLIEKMQQENGVAYFSENIYKDIEKRLEQKVETLKKIYAEQLDKERKLVEEEYASKPNEKEEKIRQLMKRFNDQMENLEEEAEKGLIEKIFIYIKGILSGIWHTFWPK